ncbi:hypothetical protein L207DRAFT_575567 [Hyaloscypha variabilis F]|uniref:BTB domain-containing protein n=1 Tax=Hyaloscypha variabilis (strain UAMH 11265 / GT02V1 / F) TaxID=1149755 RepID=A0A2J6SDT6_HYAVF|nr:hypothetical protein L207DRAFT_575567 [Hyaloscypha variabilis F]
MPPLVLKVDLLRPQITEAAQPSMKDIPKAPSLAVPQANVTVIVGKGSSSQEFKLPKDTLCYYSPFFERAFNGPFLEGRSQIMTLEDVDGAVFGLIVAWLYTKDISDEDLLIGVPSGSPNAHFLSTLRLTRLWVLGQRVLMPNLQNQVITKLQPRLAQLGGAAMLELIDYVYSGEYNELRQLFAKSLAFSFHKEELTRIFSNPSQETLSALLDITQYLKSYVGVTMTSAEASRHVNPKMFFVKDVAMSKSSEIIDLDFAPTIDQPELARTSTKRQRVNGPCPCPMTGLDEGMRSFRDVVPNFKSTVGASLAPKRPYQSIYSTPSMKSSKP